MARTVDIESQLLAPDAPTVGRQLSALTVKLYNQNNTLIDTLVYPAGITQLFDGSTGYSYKINDYDVDNTNTWPGTYLRAEYTGTDSATGGVVVWDELAFFAVEEAVPIVAVERQPYDTLANALTYCQTVRHGQTLKNYIANEPANAYRLLIEASDDIDSEQFKGERLMVYAFNTTGVVRQFPRVFNTNETVGYFPGTEGFIPSSVQRAMFEQAIWILRQEQVGHDYQGRAELQSRGLTGLSRGQSNETWDLAGNKRNRLCERAYELLRPFLAQVAGGYPGSY